MKLSNRFTLLAFGVIGLSALAASPAAAQNASACRSSVGIIGDFAERCLTKPEVNVSTAILSSVNAVNAAQDEANSKIKKPVESDDSLRNEFSYSRDAQGNLVVKNYINGLVYSKVIDGTAAGRATAAEVRQTDTRKGPTRTTVAAAPIYATTTTKSATGQAIVTNDHRNPAGAAPKPNSPPPAAAVGSMNNSATALSGQTSMARDHRH
jgi:hypothetical protein